MARGVALTGSLVVHGLVLGALGALAARGVSRPAAVRPVGASTVAIELTAPRLQSAPVMPTAAASRTPDVAVRRPTAERRATARTTGLTASGTVETTQQIEPGGGRAASAGGAAEGAAASRGGNGIGFGAGGGIASPVDTARLATPDPPKQSLARPPRLIWPVRQADVGDQPLFVAHVTVDRDGYVAGAQLVQGPGGPRDPGAGDAIWRFRYDPALDDDGRPVTAAIDQPFLLR